MENRCNQLRNVNNFWEKAKRYRIFKSGSERNILLEDLTRVHDGVIS